LILTPLVSPFSLAEILSLFFFPSSRDLLAIFSGLGACCCSLLTFFRPGLLSGDCSAFFSLSFFSLPAFGVFFSGEVFLGGARAASSSSSSPSSSSSSPESSWKFVHVMLYLKPI
jgi:hypothetical protein